MKWCIEKNCLASMAKLLGDYGKLKFTDDAMKMSFKNKHILDVDAWRKLVEGKSSAQLEDFI
jgi:hypothetical protein